MYRSKAIAQLVSDTYDVSGTGLKYYESGPLGPGGPLCPGGLGQPWRLGHLDPIRGPSVLGPRFLEDDLLAERFRHDPGHPGHECPHINYENFVNIDRKNLPIINIHIPE